MDFYYYFIFCPLLLGLTRARTGGIETKKAEDQWTNWYTTMVRSFMLRVFSLPTSLHYHIKLTCLDTALLTIAFTIASMVLPFRVHSE